MDARAVQGLRSLQHDFSTFAQGGAKDTQYKRINHFAGRFRLQTAPAGLGE